MDSQTTILLLAGGMVLILIASVGDAARRRTPLAWHAYVPWHALLFGGMTLAVLMLVHLATLYRG